MRLFIIAIIMFCFSMTKVFAGEGCDALNTYIYNLTDKTIEVQASEDFIDDNSDVKKQLIAPGKIIFMGKAKTSFNDYSFFGDSYNSYTRSVVTIFSDNVVIFYASAKKLYTKAPIENIQSSKLPLLSKFPSPYFDQRFIFDNNFNEGSCPNWQAGDWIITILNKPLTPKPDLRQAETANFPIRIHGY